MTDTLRRPPGLSRDEAFRWYQPIPDGDCLLWPSATTSAGYGEFHLRGRMYYAHVVAYELAYGPVPDGLRVDHIDCVSPACINWPHLRAVTHKQNMENRSGARKDSRSGIRGVWAVTTRQHGLHWRGQVVHNRHSYARQFPTIEEAEAWVVAKRLELFTHNEADRK